MQLDGSMKVLFTGGGFGPSLMHRWEAAEAGFLGIGLLPADLAPHLPPHQVPYMGLRSKSREHRQETQESLPTGEPPVRE